MRKFIKSLLTLSLGIFLFSCSNEEFNDTDDNSSPDLRSDIEFIYNGVTYKSTYIIGKDSIYTFDDENVTSIFEDINAFPELSTYIHPNGIEEYFKNSEIALNSLSERDPISETRQTGMQPYGTGNIFLYSHNNMDTSKDKVDFSFDIKVGLNLSSLVKNTSGPIQNNTINFNDSMCSFVVNTYGWYNRGRVFLYEHSNYKGRSIIFSFAPHQAPFREYDLRKYVIKSGGWFSRKVTWDDYVSSLRVVFN